MPTKKPAPKTKAAKKSVHVPRVNRKNQSKLVRPNALTYAQERFVDEFMRDLNVVQSSQRAGISLRSGHGYLIMPHVKAEIDARLAIRRQRSDMNEAYGMERLRMEIEYYGEGCSHAARVAAIDKLFRRLGLYQDAMTIQGNVDSPVQVQHQHGPVVIEAAKIPLDMKRKLLEYRILGHVKEEEVIDAPAD